MSTLNALPETLRTITPAYPHLVDYSQPGSTLPTPDDLRHPDDRAPDETAERNPSVESHHANGLWAKELVDVARTTDPFCA